ncbi:MAG: ribosomal L7Ae/L30e/S12e/Gadd45 family protein [Candidatus Parvarchaeota archaeon]
MKENLREKIKKNEIVIGLRETIKAAKAGKIDTIVYASNLTDEIINKFKALPVDKVEYEKDNEALSIFCGKSFKVAVLGFKK